MHGIVKHTNICTHLSPLKKRNAAGCHSHFIPLQKLVFRHVNLYFFYRMRNIKIPRPLSEIMSQDHQLLGKNFLTLVLIPLQLLLLWLRTCSQLYDERPLVSGTPASFRQSKIALSTQFCFQPPKLLLD